MMKSVPVSRNARLTSFLRNALKSCAYSAIAGGVLMSATPVQAVNYVWGDTNNAWNNNASWVPAGFPTAVGDTANFGTAATFVNPTITAAIVINTISFGAPTVYTITNTADVTLAAGGVGLGIVNNSGVTQTFNNAGAGTIFSFGGGSAGTNVVINNLATGGVINFFGTSSGGGATINNIDDAGEVRVFDQATLGNARVINAGNGSSTQFDMQGSAGSANITNAGPSTFTLFIGNSTAGSSTITNSGAGSATIIAADASGGNAAIINTAADATFDISGINAAGTTVGSIAGVGFVTLGNKNLAVGSNGLDTTFSGVISGIGGSLTMAGPGTLRLAGINTYTGNTYVNGGRLFVNGSIASPNTYVAHGALLGGIGTIGGNVFNHGTVKPGNSPGTLHVNGNYTQYSDGDLRIEIGSRNNYGRLQVGGTANLDGTVTAVAVDGYKPKRGDKYTVLTANGGVHGEFDEVKTVNFRTGTILNLDATYKSNSVILEFKRGSFLDFAKTYNQRAVARALDKVSVDGKEDRLLNHLDTRYVEDLPGDFDRIAPDELAASTEIAMSYANVTNGNISRHNDELRTGNGGYLASSLSAQGSTIAYSGPIKFRTGAAGPSGNEGKESKESKEVFEPENRWGAFLTGVGEWVDVSGDGNARGYDINTGGFTLGLDYKLTPNLAVGISAGYIGSKADLTDNGRVLVNGGKLGLYATYFTGGFYVDAAATGGYNSYDTRRKGLGGNVYGDTEGGEISAMFGTGYDVKVGNWTFGPTANVQYTYVAIDDFREHGSLAPLHVQDQDQESFRTSIGFRTSYDIKLRGGGILIRPELKLAWQHEFADDAYSIDARFRQSGDIFSVDGPEMGRDSLLLGAGFVVLFSERVSTYLYYDAQLARTNYESHSISGGVRIAF